MQYTNGGRCITRLKFERDPNKVITSIYVVLFCTYNCEIFADEMGHDS